jgi:DNA-binding response OmpR family regulator
MGQPLGGIQLKVLVAEDNKMSAKILDTLIKKAGHQCTVASDGQQAFDAYSKTPFDIIFMVRTGPLPSSTLMTVAPWSHAFQTQCIP